ncbi:MAG: diguanylate cyclase [Gammaproteobacteria bacterium]|nr:diguanylate cyclase [Gammaproteobacteria bacterium]
MNEENGLFAEDREEAIAVPDEPKEPWTILIVDDEESVHQMTLFTLEEYTFRDKPLACLSAYSSESAEKLLREHSDIAIVLLDVVMEEDDAGLKIVRTIREILKNCFVRIILRTGQPGRAPESMVVSEYDINDYVHKEELTAQKLFTLITAALRAYADIMTIESYRRNLEEKVEERTRELHAKNILLQREIRERQRVEQALHEANRELQRLVCLDGLTQIANRRRFDEYLAQEWQRLAHAQEPLSLLMCDIDYFKKYNDSYGHQAGDECLRQVAQLLKNALKRPEDLAARYGGEEFALILPNTEPREAMQAARDIQAAVQKVKIIHACSVNGYLTLSIGVTNTVPAHGPASDALVGIADNALYDAKAQGRNCIVLKQNNETHEKQDCQS